MGFGSGGGGTSGSTTHEACYTNFWSQIVTGRRFWTGADLGWAIDDNPGAVTATSWNGSPYPATAGMSKLPSIEGTPGTSYSSLSLMKFYLDITTGRSPYYYDHAYLPTKVTQLETVGETQPSASSYDLFNTIESGSDLDALRLDYDRITADIGGLGAGTVDGTQLNTLIADVLAAAKLAYTDSDIDDEVDAFTEDTLPEYMRSVNRLTGGMSDLNAVNSSAYVFGIALLEQARLKQINKFRADLTTQVRLQRSDAAGRYASQIVAWHFQYLDACRVTMQLDLAYRKMKVDMINEAVAHERFLDEKDLYWDFDSATKILNLIGAPSGSISATTQKSDIGSTLAGGLMGIGAMLSGIGGIMNLPGTPKVVTNQVGVD